VVPLNPESRFPKGYITYGPGPVMTFDPQENANVRRRDGFLEIRGTPPHAKFGIDSYAGWLAYVMPNDVTFVKRFATYPDRMYGEMAAFTISIYYYPAEENLAHRGLPVDFCELEPIGPREDIRPGRSASYTEDWWLLPQAFPKAGEDLDLKALQRLVEEKTGR
jgi:hypothetical protein